jgi:cation:H+ antiporter
MTREVLLFVGGVGVLYFGAEWLVRASARLAVSLGVSPIVLGLTVVSMGTSAPELVVSLVSAIGGHSDLAIGNVMGSNLANIGLVLGVSAIVKPLNISGRVVTREVPVMLIITALLLPLIWDLKITRLEGVAMLLVLVAYLCFVFWTAKDDDEEVLGEFAHFAEEAVGLTPWAAARDLGLIFMGISGLVLGALAIRESAVVLAEAMGISELAIGLILVSVGTSLPELATSLVATMRSEADIAVGNIIGSNVFNIAAVLGITATVTPLTVNPEVLSLEFPAVMIMSVLLLPIVMANLTIRRAEGIVLLGTYLALGAWILL